ncbi:hypothetical protein [Alkalihalobacterium elongatum]|uniref:hypothetical protein n=1 Tax=Alkalihalobacterium elongatum TaxID=2675466 RepID=UPI001C1F5849|nr:hypothetical protein [Alkalihalobacterium elongatum]
MIKKSDIHERLASLIGQELTNENLHNALFCDEKHQKIRRRVSNGTHTYITYKIRNNSNQPVVDLSISGTPNTYRLALEEKDGKLIIQSEPRINFSVL